MGSTAPEGVLFVGVAQEKVRAPRTTRKSLPGGGTIPWIMYSTAMINVYSKNTHLKPYHKQGRGLRTETTINNTGR